VRSPITTPDAINKRNREFWSKPEPNLLQEKDALAFALRQQRERHVAQTQAASRGTS
jgi:hypothetical protein